MSLVPEEIVRVSSRETDHVLSVLLPISGQAFEN